MRKQKSTSYVNGQFQKLLYAPECLYKPKDGVLPGTRNKAGTGGTPLSPEAYKAFRKAYSVEHRKLIELRAFTKFQETQLNKLLQEYGYGNVVAARGRRASRADSERELALLRRRRFYIATDSEGDCGA
eukprot:TRINITY_DN3060_c0_g1_i1.p1 TRINITY_DN3060_c0_g1~~TRINITY_DN3060_c0_g1_i1.p1  ORF type:complete len:129 (+),score=8.18 TRINITY_DN3060_c0_g1_i1:319-705(+)